MHPIVDIICSSPAMNTHSKKCNIPHLNPTLLNNGEGALDIHYPQYHGQPWDSPSHTKCIYDLQDLNEEDITDWRRIKKHARVRHMRKIRRRAELLVQLKRELRQLHKLSKTENGFPDIHWWHLGYWDMVLGEPLQSKYVLDIILWQSAV